MDLLRQFLFATFTHHFALSPDTLIWSRVTFFLRQRIADSKIICEAIRPYTEIFNYVILCCHNRLWFIRIDLHKLVVSQGVLLMFKKGKTNGKMAVT